MDATVEHLVHDPWLVRRLPRLIAEAGRDYETVPMSVFWPQPDTELLKRYAGAGINRAVLLIETAGRDDVLRKLEEQQWMLRAQLAGRP